jgi:tetratricopeptide (TPR) repeat protein
MDFLEQAAEEAESSGDLLLALQLWNEVAHAHRDPLFFIRYGRVAQTLEKWDEAEGAFVQALRLDKTFALAMEGMGDLWATRTDKSDLASFEIAKDWFLKALKYERNARTLTFLGSTYRALHDDAAAHEAFTEAVVLDPEYEEALYNLALTESQQNPQKSIELLEKAIAIDSEYFAAHQAIGKLYQKSADLPRAEYHFRRSLEIDETDLWSRLFLANALAVQGNYDDAEHNYLRAMHEHPGDSQGLEFFVRFLESIGRHDQASALRMSRGLAE